MVHEALKEYVKNNDVDSIRYIFIDSFDVDPTLKEYDDDLKYCEEKGINLFIEHKDLNKLIEDDSGRWNENYCFMLKKDLMENFSEKRFNHMKEVAKVIYAEKIKRLKAEREERKEIPIEKEKKNKSKNFEDNRKGDKIMGNNIKQITVKYNPYRLKTELKIDGEDIKKDSNLYNIVATGNRLQEWVEDFPKLLVNELNINIFNINFYGTQIDFDDFKEVFEQAKKDRVIDKGSEIHFIKGKSDEDIKKDIVKAFKDLQEGPVEDFKYPKLIKAFEDINNSIFPINVIATMSSGKSTLINALLQKELMPSKNEACTAIITEILNSNKEQFNAVVYDKNGNELESISNLTYEKMDELNSNSNVSKIEAEGKIPFIKSIDMKLQIIDTPGPNNANNKEHKTTTYEKINNNSNNLILYILNGTQLSTNDDKNFLEYVSEQIKKGGKQARDRFIFVINKMDLFNSEKENIEKVINNAKIYLNKFGIENPQVFPCSAYTALNIRTVLKNIDIKSLTRNEERKLSSDARDTLPAIYKFNDYEDMHLEKYTTLPLSIKRELNYKLEKAKKEENEKEQALIHCGIYSIEAIINTYVNKYAKTKQIKDLVETFEGILESNQTITKVKKQIADNEEVAKEIKKRAKEINEKISNGKEAKKFEEKIDKLNPINIIKKEEDNLQNKVLKKIQEMFNPYGKIITNKGEAQRLVESLINSSVDWLSQLSVEVNKLIDDKLVKAANQMLEEYKVKLTKIDDAAASMELDFSTVDMIKGSLSNMKAEIQKNQNSKDFSNKTVENIGISTQEEKIYYEKVGEEKIEVKVGSHEEKVDTKIVKVGSHEEWVGTKKVKNPEREGFFGWFKFWEDKYIEQNVYRTVDDYEEQDIYQIVDDYETQIKDIMKKRIEKIDKFTIHVSDLQTALVAPIRKGINEGMKASIKYAEKQIDDIKKQFKDSFYKLDNIIKDKYAELTKYANEEKENDKKYKDNQKVLDWIEYSIKEINDIIDI